MKSSATDPRRPSGSRTTTFVSLVGWLHVLGAIASGSVIANATGNYLVAIAVIGCGVLAKLILSHQESRERSAHCSEEA